MILNLFIDTEQNSRAALDFEQHIFCCALPTNFKEKDSENKTKLK